MTTAVDVYDLARAPGAPGRPSTPRCLPPAAGSPPRCWARRFWLSAARAAATYNAVEAYDTVANTWRTLEPMPTARHGIQAAVCNGGVYIAAGGKRQGGGGATNVHEVFFLKVPQRVSQPDTTAPVVKAATQILIANSTLSASTLPVRLHWSATDSGTG